MNAESLTISGVGSARFQARVPARYATRPGASGGTAPGCTSVVSVRAATTAPAALTYPRAISATRLAATVGVSQETLSRWLRQARSVPGMTAAMERRVVLAAEGLEDAALGALLRQEGLHAAQKAEWRAAAETALDTPPTRRPSGPSPEAQRIVALERALRRNEAALAETAALLVLKKQSK